MGEDHTFWVGAKPYQKFTILSYFIILNHGLSPHTWLPPNMGEDRAFWPWFATMLLYLAMGKSSVRRVFYGNILYWPMRVNDLCLTFKYPITDKCTIHV